MSTGLDGQQFAEAVASASPVAAENLSPALGAAATGGQFTPVSTNGTTYTTGGGGAGMSTTSATALFTAEQVEAARAQEKEKLYPQIERMKSQLDELQKQQAEREADEAARIAAAEAEARRLAEEEMTARELIEAQRAEFADQLAAERRERESALAMLDMERQYQELQAWKIARIEQERDNIMPDLLDLVSGSSPDEIEASITDLKGRTARILESATAALSSTRRDMVGSRVTAPAAGPLDTQTGQRQFSPEELRNMPLSEYEKYRSSLLGAAAAPTGRGLFG
jgi:hypothetical protein